MKVVIDRRKWYRGTLLGSRLWLNDINKGCCLGHAMHQVCGITLDQLVNKGMPRNTWAKTIGSLNIEVFYDITDDRSYIENTEFAVHAILINDDNKLSDVEREKMLISLFKENGIKLSFKN